MPKRRTSRVSGVARRPEPSLTSGAYALAAIGPHTGGVIFDLAAKEGDLYLFARAGDEDLKRLAEAFRDWEDERAAKVVSRYLADLQGGDSHFDVDMLCLWATSHVNNCKNVFECMAVIPPERIVVTRLLSRAGSQKVVFLANWTLGQRAVVLKRLSGPREAQDRIAERESQAHPLSMAHPNIIETFEINNRHGDKFLVEERLPFVLEDDWRCRGLQEAANLLYDIASALHYLHSDLKRAHGDIKPDNIGRRGGDYILLDFGICRPIDQFVDEATPTGSLRTRAPELLIGASYCCPTRADVWSLGATVYNAAVGRFPFFDANEKPPRISHPKDRENFEDLLRARIHEEWDARVDLTLLPEQLRRILGHALERDPQQRWTAAQILSAAKDEFAGFLRNNSEDGFLSPLDELDQLVQYLPATDVLRLMPVIEKDILVQKLARLSGFQGASRESREKASRIIEEIS
jgi:serine/threonine protein kinase